MKKVLIIEDNPAIRTNIVEILELAQYRTQTAENGKTGMEQAIQFQPDLIICDIVMPELDGYGVIQAIQKNPGLAQIPFIFLTGKSEKDEIRKAMDMGADDYITKPFSGTELLSAVESRLSKMERTKKDLEAKFDKSTPQIESLSETALFQSITEGRVINRYKKKQLIYSEGNHPNRLYYVIKGKIKAYKANDFGKELVTELYRPGDFIGHVAILENSVYKRNAEAMEDSELAVIPREDFMELINNHPLALKRFVQLLASDVTRKEERLISLAYNSLRRKVADALLALQAKYKESNEQEFSIDISRESLASISGTATESLIRTLSDFKQEKLIAIRDGKIFITNASKLERMYN
jgi:CRP/FNR family cyclic AMP-dependent transcriptional regulator